MRCIWLTLQHEPVKDRHISSIYTIKRTRLHSPPPPPRWVYQIITRRVLFLFSYLVHYVMWEKESNDINKTVTMDRSSSNIKGWISTLNWYKLCLGKRTAYSFKWKKLWRQWKKCLYMYKHLWKTHIASYHNLPLIACIYMYHTRNKCWIP